MSALQQVQRESAYLEALERAGGDHERLARGLMTACLELAAKNEALMTIAATRQKPKRPNAGRPKEPGNPLPMSTKAHAKRALARKLKYRGMNNREAAIFELLDSGVLASETDGYERLVSNLQKRIAEAMSRL
ncbi:MAG: hypothetical protein LPJ87_00120 [Zoogloeaceae bacterium]|nr:hypothetical protein [Zoogloeaceae bacterium]